MDFYIAYQGTVLKNTYANFGGGLNKTHPELISKRVELVNEIKLLNQRGLKSGVLR